MANAMAGTGIRTLSKQAAALRGYINNYIQRLQAFNVPTVMPVFERHL